MVGLNGTLAFSLTLSTRTILQGVRLYTPATIKLTHTCTKCKSRRFLVSNEFRTPTYGHNITMRFPLVSAKLPGFVEDVYLGGWFETWTCASCGFTEWYAQGLDQIDLSQTGDHMRYFDAGPPPPDGAPFR